MNMIDELGELALSTRLMRLSEVIRKDITRIYMDHELEFESKWFPVFYVLSQKSPLCVIELAEEIGYAHPSVIALVREMEKKKLVRSVANKTDGRKRMLSLTPKAKTMVDQLKPLWDNFRIVARQIYSKENNLLNAIEATEANLGKVSYYDRYKKMEASVSNQLPPGFEIAHTTQDDLEFIDWMFEEAIAFHQKNNYPVWQKYDEAFLLREIREKQQYKIRIDGHLALIFSVVYSDPMLWRQKEKGNALYLHRIVVNPHFKKRRLFGVLLNWAIHHARVKGIKYIRMDTWGDNPKIIDYYKSFGFRFVENYTTSNSAELPAPNRNLYIALLELEVSD